MEGRYLLPFHSVDLQSNERERERERERARERERVARLREMVLVGVFYEDVTNVQQWLLGVLTESVARTLLLLLK